MALFNEANSWLVFALKIVFLGTNILAGFAAIQLFHDDRLLSVISAAILFDNLCLFNLIYDKGFSIPRRAAKLRSLLVLQLRLAQVVTDRERDTLRRQVKSIGNVAVRVGQFHYLERTSTPRYLDFSVKHIMRVVMAYRRNSSNL